MTKQEGIKLGNSIIDYLVRLCQFERREDITLRVLASDIPATDDGGESYIDGRLDQTVSHGLFTITIYINDDTTKDEFIEVIMHELGHLFAYEFRAYYDTFVDVSEEDSIAEKVFVQHYERIAKRYSMFLRKLWGVKK
jgi:hypothetical protein